MVARHRRCRKRAARALAVGNPWTPPRMIEPHPGRWPDDAIEDWVRHILRRPRSNRGPLSRESRTFRTNRTVPRRQRALRGRYVLRSRKRSPAGQSRRYPEPCCVRRRGQGLRCQAPQPRLMPRESRVATDHSPPTLMLAERVCAVEPKGDRDLQGQAKS